MKKETTRKVIGIGAFILIVFLLLRFFQSTPQGQKLAATIGEVLPGLVPGFVAGNVSIQIPGSDGEAIIWPSPSSGNNGGGSCNCEVGFTDLCSMGKDPQVKKAPNWASAITSTSFGFSGNNVAVAYGGTPAQVYAVFM